MVLKRSVQAIVTISKNYMVDYLTPRSPERSNESINTKNPIAQPPWAVKLSTEAPAKTSAYKQHKNGKKKQKKIYIDKTYLPKNVRKDRDTGNLFPIEIWKSPAARQVCLIVRNSKKKKKRVKERIKKEREKCQRN